MNLSSVKLALSKINTIEFILPDGKRVAPHFHVTEIGSVFKKFIDCGGTLRETSHISFQLWEASDINHRLTTDKLLKIIELSEAKLNLLDQEVEVEYQGQTIETYALEFDGESFLLISKNTDCLAPNKCGIEEGGKSSLKLACCETGSGCC